MTWWAKTVYKNWYIHKVDTYILRLRMKTLSYPKILTMDVGGSQKSKSKYLVNSP